jgi:hypothetical protein
VSASGKNKPRPESGSIIGKALYAGGQSHAGIAVSIEKTDGLRSAAVLSSARSGAFAERTAAASVMTKEDGSYGFAAVNPGLYTVYAASGNSTEKAVAVNITVEADRAVTAADMNLTPAGSITSRVALGTGGTGSKMGFLVFIAGTSYMAAIGEDGSFVMSGVSAGSGYTLVIMKGTWTDIWQTVNVQSGETAEVTPKTVNSADLSGGLIWKGELPAASVASQPNWAYYNTAAKTSYIWNGSGWDTQICHP